MAHIAIRKMSEMDGCWSALRATKHCEECKRVEYCQFQEAAIGRVRVAHQKVEKAEQRYSKALADLAEAKKLVNFRNNQGS